MVCGLANLANKHNRGYHGCQQSRTARDQRLPMINNV